MTTTPLDPPAVFKALQNATSQNPAQLRAAAKAIEAMHKSADYLQIVQSIALERSVPLDIRKMAILQFKNVATSQWRTKMYVRAKLCQSGVGTRRNREYILRRDIITQNTCPNLVSGRLRPRSAGTQPCSRHGDNEGITQKISFIQTLVVYVISLLHRTAILMKRSIISE